MTVGPRPGTGDVAGAGRAGPDTPAKFAARVQSIDARSLLSLAAMVIAGGWAGYFLFTGMPQLTLHVFPRTIALHAMAGTVALVYLAYLIGSRRLPGGTPLDAPVLGLIAAYALATYTSINWRVSLEATLQFGIALIAFYALSDLPFLSARQLRRALMLTGGALALYALWVVGGDYVDYLKLADRVEGLGIGNILPPTVPRVHDVSDHPNVLAMVLTLVLPFYALSAYRPAAWWERVAGLAGLFVGGWAIFLTLSRGGWLGAGFAIAGTLAGAWLTLRDDDRRRAGRPLAWDTFVPGSFSPTAVAAVVGALALAVFGTFAFLAKSSTRPGWLFRSSLSPRQDAWHVGRQIFEDNWLTGAGPNTFGLLFPQYSRHAAEFIVHTQHAHNGFLQAADDLGIVGVLALIGLAAALLYTLWRTWRDGTMEQRLLAVACASGLLGFTLHNQVDAGNIWKAPGIALAFVGAIVIRNYRESRPPREPRPGRAVPAPTELVRRYGGLAARIVLLGLLVVPLLGWYRIDRAHHDYWLGVEHLNEGQTDGIAELQAAVNADSSMAVYQLQLGQAQAAAYDRTGRTDDPLIAAAIIHLEQAVKLDGRSDLARADLARAYQFAGRNDDAAAQAQLARLAVYHVPPVLLAGQVYEDIGRADDAVSTYGQALSMDGGLANSTFWQETAFRRDHFDDILKSSTIGINPCTQGAYLVEAHRYDPQFSLDGLAAAADGCKFLLFTGGLGDDLVTRVALAKVQMQLGDTQDAFGHLDFAVKRQPDFGPARTELGRWYAANGDLDEARHQWVVGAQLDEAESVLLLGDSYPAGQVPAGLSARLEALLKTSGSSVQDDLVSVLYYRMRYGRISPVAALIPGDWQTALPRPYVEMQDALRRWQQ